MTGPREDHNLGVPLSIGLVALLLSLGFQTFGLMRERSAIAAAGVEMAAAVQEGDRVRVQLDTLLSGANELAQKGDATAAAVMADLAKQGIGYTPPTR